MPFSYRLARNTNTFKLLESDNNLCTQRVTTLDIFRCTVIMLSIVDLEMPNLSSNSRRVTLRAVAKDRGTPRQGRRKLVFRGGD